MEIVEISVRKGRTVNTGNYGSRRVDVGLTVRLGENDNFFEAFSQVNSQVEAFLRAAELEQEEP